MCTTPWGLSRMRPYPAPAPHIFASVAIDPQTQLAIYRDDAGQILELGKHGTSKGTETNPQSTNQDSRNDTDHDQDSTQD